MSGMMAKTLHPACALVGYTIITTLVFGGLFSSAFNMFAVVTVPTCMDGTTSTPYSFQLSAEGVPNPSTGPNAPNSGAVPFCSSDALSTSTYNWILSYGYLGLEYSRYNFFSASQYQTITFPFCFKLSNGTCPTKKDAAANFQIGAVRTDNSFLMTEKKDFKRAHGGYMMAISNNYPVTFGGPPGTILPGGIDASKTYYLRNYVGGDFTTTFRIAADTTSLPMTFSSYPTNNITVTFSDYDSCPAEQDTLYYQNPTNPANVNFDGTLKTDTQTCGYCLTQPLQTANRATIGLCAITITLLLVIDLMICIPVIRKMAFFRILFIVINVVCIVFLIAAVSSASVTFLQVAKCFSHSDLSQTQFMPSPIGTKINGYTPSSGGSECFLNNGAGLFRTRQASGVAAYNKPYVLPNTGAVQLIIAIVFMFLFTIVFAIKVDWTAASSTAGANSLIQMTYQ